MYTVTAHIHRDHLPNRVATRPVCVNTAREGSMGARNHPMGHADAHEPGAAATFDSHRVSPLPGWCTRWQPRRKMERKRIARSADVTDVLSDMSRLSRVEPEPSTGAMGALRVILPS